MLAQAEEREATAGGDLRRADVVVAVQGCADAADALGTGQRVARQLALAYPGRAAAVVLLSEAAAEGPAALRQPASEAGVPVLPWRHPGQGAVEAALRAAESLDAEACAVVAPDRGGTVAPERARQLLAPVLDDGFDLACPCYPLRRFEGVLVTGVVYPLLRALFGRRLRQPVPEELALSRRLRGHLLGEAWQADGAHAGERMWVVTSALARDFRICQRAADERPQRTDAGTDLAATLAHLVGLVFHAMRLHAPVWQRVKGSQPVRSYGDLPPAPSEEGHPQMAPMISAFQLGYQELGPLWSAVLPPQTMLALKRLTRAGESDFRMDDALWARAVYDFALGYHLATMDRALLLRAMTPLYLAWTASFVAEVRQLEPAAVEARVERLCRAFEAGKPYLIGRWRWPDRFNP